MQKEYKVGEKIKLGNVTLLVEQRDRMNCVGCFFDRICNHNLFTEVKNMVGGCVPCERTNGDNVIFVKVEEE